MKKTILLLAFCGASVLTMSAQDDDLYFTPKKSAGAKALDDNTPAYYAGTNRSVDEYNRRGNFRSRYLQIDADTVGDGGAYYRSGSVVLPDSTYYDDAFGNRLNTRGNQGYYDNDDDYMYTRCMSRWDGFYGPWYAGWHSPIWYSRYGWYDPWYYDYAGWYDPWYNGYCGWYDPWYYGRYWGGYWGWHSYYNPWFRPGWGGVAVVPGGTGRTIAGTRNHGTVAGRQSNSGSAHFGSRSNHGTATSQLPGRFGSPTYNTPNHNANNSNFGNTSPSFRYNGSRSYSSGSSSAGNSFGGSRSGGGFSGGGGHSGGGAHFGGRR